MPLSCSVCFAYAMIHVGDVIGYASAPDALIGSYERSALTVVPATAAAAPATRRGDEVAGLVLDRRGLEARRPSRRRGRRSRWRRRSVFTICATPAFLVPPWVVPSDVQFTVSPLPSVQSVGSTSVRNFVKLLVVPEPSARCATVIAVDGSVTPGLSAAIAASFHVLIFSEKILASVVPLSCSLSRRSGCTTP